MTCKPIERDRYCRLVASCRVGRTDVAAWLINNGWAVAYRQYSTAYVPQEDQARRKRRGIWAGTFDMPGEWRKAY